MAHSVPLQQPIASSTDVGSPAETAAGVPPPSSATVALEVLAGMAAGAVTGAIAGPPGMIAGAVLGSAMGAAAGIALDAQNLEESRKDEELDRDIGVVDGNIGEASPNQPPITRGTFSAASMGVANEVAVSPAEGPIPNVGDE
ncbi:MAG TPA: hypothetical protein VE093_20615 [Polyangiaceae bacterium]|nr:hypothetical protein [Polyangiaceae bacterium]